MGRGSLWSPFHPNSTSHLGSGVTDGSVGSGSAHGQTLIPVGPGVVLETSTLIASSMPSPSPLSMDSNNTTATRRELLRSLCQVVNETEMTVEVCILAKPSFTASVLSQDPSISKGQGGAVTVVEEEVFENERYDDGKKQWGHQFLADGERRRYNTRREDGGGDSLSFPQVSLPSGWEWNSSWKVELGQGTDDEGWCYGLLWSDVNFPFDPEWNMKGEVQNDNSPFEVRRRRWTRTRSEVSR